jgi:hypothetical protein
MNLLKKLEDLLITYRMIENYERTFIRHDQPSGPQHLDSCRTCTQLGGSDSHAAGEGFTGGWAVEGAEI